MKRLLISSALGLASLLISVSWLAVPARAEGVLIKEEVSTQTKSDALVLPKSLVESGDYGQVVNAKIANQEEAGSQTTLKQDESRKRAEGTVLSQPVDLTKPMGGELDGNSVPELSESEIDVRIVKVQLKQGNLKTNQLVVLKNYGPTVKLERLKLQLFKGDSPVRDREVVLGKLQFGKAATELATGEMLILVNDLELAKHFLNLQTNLVQCLSDCQPTKPWLEPARAKQAYQLKLINRSTSEVANYFKYSKNVLPGYHQFGDYDFLSIVTVNGKESDAWQGFLAVRTDPIWLKAEQLPPLMAPELKCKAGEELVSGECLVKCPKNYSRSPVTGICERDPCPTGKFLDVQADSCVIDPASCGDGSVYNPQTKRCNKKVVVEPKICPVGYYLNPTTNRCNKIPLAVIKTPCPEGQLRHPETGRCRKIVLEADCQADQELVGQKCLKKCPEGQLRNPITHRCQKAIEACPVGFERDATGVCIKRNQVATAQQLETLAHQPVKNYQFDWLKLFNSPIGGALAASVVFVIYDKFFRAKN